MIRFRDENRSSEGNTKQDHYYRTSTLPPTDIPKTFLSHIHMYLYIFHESLNIFWSRLFKNTVIYEGDLDTACSNFTNKLKQLVYSSKTIHHFSLNVKTEIWWRRSSLGVHTYIWRPKFPLTRHKTHYKRYHRALRSIFP